MQPALQVVMFCPCFPASPCGRPVSCGLPAAPTLRPRLATTHLAPTTTQPRAAGVGSFAPAARWHQRRSQGHRRPAAASQAHAAAAAAAAAVAARRLQTARRPLTHPHFCPIPQTMASYAGSRFHQPSVAPETGSLAVDGGAAASATLGSTQVRTACVCTLPPGAPKVAALNPYLTQM